MSISFHGRTLNIGDQSILLDWPVLEAIEEGGQVFVLFDPDSYILDPNYKKIRRQGSPAIRNLVAYARNGERIWEAELPEQVDYYYRIVSSKPLVVNSFSSYRCEIRTDDGRILTKEFLK
jgi:hypothetical protein